MTETVLVTEAEYAKGAPVFAACESLKISPAPAAENELAGAVERQRARAVIVGVTAYRGPLYEALAAQGEAIVARFGVGHDGIDKPLAARLGITVTNTPGVLDQSVAEHAIWLIGSLARRVPAAHDRLRQGQFHAPAGIELGILGFGRIGRQVARIAAFGLSMRVVAAGSRPAETIERDEGRSFEEVAASCGIEHYTTDARLLCQRADVLSIHLPARADTHRYIDHARLGWLKPQSLLINTARGSVVDEAALYDALAEGRIAAAALDVFAQEPYQPAAADKDLRTLENVVLTPHIGSNTLEANRRMAEASLANVADFLAGRRQRLARVV